jgi:hypothetical protein
MHGFISCLCLILFFIFSYTANAQRVSLSEPVQGWSRLVRAANIDTKYEVKSGDTLYDISDILFGDANYWPKIWSLNKVITNPHIIEVGQVVYFDSGSVLRPPTVRLTPKSGVYLMAENYKNPIIPKQIPKPKLRILPDSLPKGFGSSGLEEEQEIVLKNLEVGKRFVLEEQSASMLYTEILSRRPESIGKLSLVEDNSNFAKVNSEVVLRLNEGVRLGQKLSLFRDESRALSMNIIEWLGEVQVTEELSDSKYKAVVVFAHEDILVNSLVSLEPLRYVKYGEPENEAVLTDMKIKVIGGEGKLGRVLLSDGDFVYLNKGSSRGVSKGDVYLLGKSLKSYYTISQKNDVPKVSSLVKVVSSDEGYSTGVIFSIDDIVGTGAETRTE